MPKKSEKFKEPKEDYVATKGLDITSAKNSWGFKGQNYLFTIGIDKYQYWPPLKSAVKDVQDFAKILTERYQFDETHWTFLKNEEATEKNILSTFRQLTQKVTDQDNLVIYFSGHGHYYEDTKTGFWVPVDAQMGEENEYQFINTAIIVDKLRNINTLHTFLIVDACFSGTILHRIKAGTSPKSERYKSRIVFASGRDEVVSDGIEGSNSPFAKGILNTLKLNTDKHISASKLILEVKEYVPKEAQQNPIDGRIMGADDQGGDFVFHLKMSEAEIWAGVVEQHTKEAYKKFMEQFPQSEHQQEAQEAYDWLTCLEEHSIESLRRYLNKYQPGGKYIPLAIQTLEAIEEEQCWGKAKAKDTLSAYFDYLYRYPKGKYIEEAKMKTTQMEEDEDDVAFEKAIEKDSTEAYQDYIKKPGNKKYREQAKEKLSKLSSRSTEPSEVEKAWENARNSGTYTAYRDFTQAFPQSPLIDKARQDMKRMDDVALNQIRLMEHNGSLSLQEKINQCITYFNNFPGAGNNQRVKQIKDRLEIQKYSKGL